jgi:broad specificity phosphatase PhoE
MTTLLLTRHGQTEWNLERRLQGRFDAPLTPLGVRQAVELGRRLEERTIDAVYVSPTNRTRETARLLLRGRDLPVLELDDLREMDLGPWQGMRIDDVARAWPEEHHLFWNAPRDYVPAAAGGGESFGSFRARGARVLEALRARAPHGSLLVVTHSLVVKALWLVATGRPVDDMWTGEEIAGGSLTELEHVDGGWRVVRLGDEGHVLAETAVAAASA